MIASDEMPTPACPPGAKRWRVHALHHIRSSTYVSTAWRIACVLLAKWCMPRLLVLGTVLLAVSLGCSGIPIITPPVPDVAPQRKARREAAMREFERARNIAQYESVLARWRQGDEAGSLAELRLLVERDPQWPPAQQLLADVLIARDEVVEAESILRQLLQQETTWRDSLSLGLLLETEGRESEAAFYFAQARELAPDDVATAEVMAMLAPGEESTAREAVLASYSSERRVDISTDVRDSFGGWARTASGRRLLDEASEVLALGDSAGAVLLILAAIHDEPQNRDIPYKTATALIRSNRSAFAIEILELSLPHHPGDAELFRLYGAALIEAGRHHEAQTALYQALSLDNRSALTYFLLAGSLKTAGDTGAAVPLYERAAQLDPRFSVTR